MYHVFLFHWFGFSFSFGLWHYDGAVVALLFGYDCIIAAEEFLRDMKAHDFGGGMIFGKVRLSDYVLVTLVTFRC